MMDNAITVQWWLSVTFNYSITMVVVVTDEWIGIDKAPFERWLNLACT